MAHLMDMEESIINNFQVEVVESKIQDGEETRVTRTKGVPGRITGIDINTPGQPLLRVFRV